MYQEWIKTYDEAIKKNKENAKTYDEFQEQFKNISRKRLLEILYKSYGQVALINKIINSED